MGDLNQLEYIKKNAHLARGPILEIGSKDYGNTPDYRMIFPAETYIGVDLNKGKGVDVEVDISGEYENIVSKLKISRFNAIIVFSVLEHCLELSRACSNIEKLLNKDGLLFVSVPFCWEYHGFPNDYWRFTPNGIKALFPNLEFIDSLTQISTSRTGEMKNLRNEPEYYKLDLSPREGIRKKRYGLSAGVLLKILKCIPACKPILDYTYLMPPVLISMVGRKKS